MRYLLLIFMLFLVLPAFAGRKLTLGHEFGNTTTKGIPSAEGYDVQVWGGGINWSTNKRSGVNSRVYQLQNGNLQQDLITGITITPPWNLRVYYHVDSDDNTPSQAIPLVSIVETGASNAVGLWLSRTRRLALAVNGVLQDSTTDAVTNAGGWYLVEIRSTWLATGNTHTMVVNNSQTMTSTANLPSLSASAVTYWAGNYAANTVIMAMAIDDIALNDASGAYENAAPDDTAHIVFMPVVVDTSIGDWTGGAGATTSLFEALNNIPPAGVGTDADATNITNSTSSATSNYDGATLSYNAFGIPAGNGLRVLIPVTRHGEHAAAGDIAGAVRLVSNPPDTAEVSFTFGSGSGAHGNDNATGVMKWYTTYGNPVYGVFADQHVNRDARPVLRVGKRTATTDRACVDLLGLVVEYGTPYPTTDGFSQ